MAALGLLVSCDFACLAGRRLHRYGSVLTGVAQIFNLLYRHKCPVIALRKVNFIACFQAKRTCQVGVSDLKTQIVISLDELRKFRYFALASFEKPSKKGCGSHAGLSLCTKSKYADLQNFPACVAQRQPAQSRQSLVSTKILSETTSSSSQDAAYQQSMTGHL